IQRVCTSLCACAIALLGVSCGRDDPSTDARPVRTLTVARSDEGEPITLTGELRPAIQVNIAFRLSGRLLERDVNVGDHVHAGQLIAKLDPQNQQNNLVSSQAGLAASDGELIQARAAFARQKTLIAQGATSRAQYDQARQSFQVAQSKVVASNAQLHMA